MGLARQEKKDSSIYIAGHKGLVGSAIERKLRSKGFSNIITIDKSELDLTNSDNVSSFFSNNKIEYIFDAAAKVGGISANDKYSHRKTIQKTSYLLVFYVLIFRYPQLEEVGWGVTNGLPSPSINRCVLNIRAILI